MTRPRACKRNNVKRSSAEKEKKNVFSFCFHETPRRFPLFPRFLSPLSPSVHPGRPGDHPQNAAPEHRERNGNFQHLGDREDGHPDGHGRVRERARSPQGDRERDRRRGHEPHRGGVEPREHPPVDLKVPEARPPRQQAVEEEDSRGVEAEPPEKGAEDGVEAAVLARGSGAGDGAQVGSEVEERSRESWNRVCFVFFWKGGKGKGKEKRGRKRRSERERERRNEERGRTAKEKGEKR